MDKTKKRNFLSMAMLLAPFVICITVFIDLMINIDQYNLIGKMDNSIWVYFSFAVIISIIGLLSAAYVLVHVLVLKKDIKHIRTVIITSHLGFLLELLYIIEYVALMRGKANGLSIAALVFGVLGIAGFFVAMGLKKGPNFLAYFVSSLLYFIFMILMASLLNTRDNGMHIIMLVFCSIAIGLACYGIYTFYLKKEK